MIGEILIVHQQQVRIGVAYNNKDMGNNRAILEALAVQTITKGKNTRQRILNLQLFHYCLWTPIAISAKKSNVCISVAKNLGRLRFVSSM